MCSSGVYVFFERCTNGARTGHKLLEVVDDLAGQTALVQIDCKNRGVGQNGTQLFRINFAAERHTGEMRLHGFEQRVRTARERLAGVVHPDEVAQPAG